VRPLRRARGAAVVDVADDEVSLVLRVGRGDEQAFSQLYDLLASMVHGVVLRVIRDPEQAAEVTQEVFVEIWRIAPRYDQHRGSPRAWVATIAHRRAVDRVRSEEASRTRDSADARIAVIDVRDTAEEVTDRLDVARVGHALRALSEKQREAVELAYYGGRTHREVATLLEIPEGTAKTRIRDGLIRLRDLLGVDDEL